MLGPVLEIMYGDDYPELMGNDGKANRQAIYEALKEQSAELMGRSFLRRMAHRTLNLARTGNRVAARIIRPVARKVLGDNPSMSRTAAKSLLLPAATAAVASSAPFVAPAVPVVVNQIIDEIYSGVKKGFGTMKKSLLPDAEAPEGTEPTREELLKIRQERRGGKSGFSPVGMVMNLPTWGKITLGGGSLVLIAGTLYLVFRDGHKEKVK